MTATRTIKDWIWSREHIVRVRVRSKNIWVLGYHDDFVIVRKVCLCLSFTLEVCWQEAEDAHGHKWKRVRLVHGVGTLSIHLRLPL